MMINTAILRKSFIVYFLVLAIILVTASSANVNSRHSLALKVPPISGNSHFGKGLKSKSTTNYSGYGWSSANWSGYAITTSQSFYEVSGTWIVPKVAPSKQSTFSATWVGIDGFNNNYLIQTGTEQDYYFGSAHYTAWWSDSNVGFVEQPLNISISPGDKMYANIDKVSSSSWDITLTDVTTNASVTISVSYPGPGESAEWIVEAPVVNGRIATLANYGQTTFDLGTQNNSSPAFTLSDAGFMVRHNRVVSIPSGPDSDADGFNIAYGSVAPQPPSS